MQLAAPAVPKGRILVVEDEDGVRDLLQLHLANEGYEVACARDAIEAGHAILRDPHALDLLIVDAQLPHLSGIEFASTLIADTSLPLIPLILISGHDHLVARADAIGVPCLRKPFFADALIELVERTRTEAKAGVAAPEAASAGLRNAWTGARPMRAGSGG